MADYTFNTPAGQTVGRELLLLYDNTSTASAPVWSPIGKRVEDSSMEMDWSIENKTDIFGDTWSTGKKATRTQTFDPCELDSADEAQKRIWKQAIVDNDVNALMAHDMLIVHAYAKKDGATGGAVFAERYSSCSVAPSSLGGEGGGTLGMPIDVTFGGERTVGTAVMNGRAPTFTADSDN